MTAGLLVLCSPSMAKLFNDSLWICKVLSILKSMTRSASKTSKIDSVRASNPWPRSKPIRAPDAKIPLYLKVWTRIALWIWRVLKRGRLLNMVKVTPSVRMSLKLLSRRGSEVTSNSQGQFYQYHLGHREWLNTYLDHLPYHMNKSRNNTKSVIHELARLASHTIWTYCCCCAHFI